MRGTRRLSPQILSLLYACFSSQATEGNREPIEGLGFVLWDCHYTEGSFATVVLRMSRCWRTWSLNNGTLFSMLFFPFDDSDCLWMFLNKGRVRLLMKALYAAHYIKLPSYSLKLFLLPALNLSGLTFSGFSFERQIIVTFSRLNVLWCLQWTSVLKGPVSQNNNMSPFSGEAWTGQGEQDRKQLDGGGETSVIFSIPPTPLFSF